MPSDDAKTNLPQPSRCRCSPSIAALRIAVIYAVAAAAWIVISDLGLAHHIDTVVGFSMLSVYKGLVFVLVTAGLLFVAIRGRVHDIYRAEDQRRSSDERFRALFDDANVGVALVALDGRFTETNPAMQRMLGYSGEELARRTIADLTHPDDVRISLDRFDALLANRSATNPIEKRYIRKDGVAIWVRNTSSVARDQRGAAQFLVTVSEDITERVHNEAALLSAKESAEAANNAKDRFLSVLSHELRTPLTPVLANVCAILADRSLPSKFRADVEVIRRNVELEARVIDDLLDLTRITQNRLQIKNDPVDVHAAIRGALDIVQADITARQLRRRVELTATQSTVRGDAARLLQVFWNLIRNAVKFTPPGGAVTIRTENGPDGSLVVEVTDTGVGISEEALPHVFDAFSDRSQAAARQFGGLGLGLAISQAVVSLHGGKLTVSSAGAGRGATFSLCLPTIETPAPALAPDEPSRATAPSTILLVEDHADTAKSLARLLGMIGYNVKMADSVQAAVDLAGRESFDLLLSDIALPDGDGVEVLHRLSADRPIRAIAMSGFGMEADIRRSLDAGFIEHLTKPIDFDRLERLLRQVISSPPPAPAHA